MHQANDPRREILEFTLANSAPARSSARTHCRRGHELTEENVYEYSNGVGRVPTRRCRQCSLDAAARWAAAHPERKRELDAARAPKFRDPDKDRRSWLRRRYGITAERFDELLAAQLGRCPICNVELTRVMQLDARGNKTHQSNSAVVDHCHVTGVVRGILCIICNKALGGFRDDTDLLRAAVAYLEAPR